MVFCFFDHLVFFLFGPLDSVHWTRSFFVKTITHFFVVTAKVELGEDPATALGTREESEEGDINDQLEDLFAAVMTTTDPTDIGRPLNIVFRLLPSPKVTKFKCTYMLILYSGSYWYQYKVFKVLGP